MTAATNALDILAEVRRHGGDVWVSGPDRLKVLAPPALLPDLVAKVRAVKPDLLAALADADAESKDWQARHAEALAYWHAFHSADEGERIAWGEMANLWRRRYGGHVAAGMCAGWDMTLGEAPALTLADGTAVHITALDCLILYGCRWRGAAARALEAAGIPTPPAIAAEIKELGQECELPDDRTA
jgi:hypothetical protein